MYWRKPTMAMVILVTMVLSPPPIHGSPVDFLSPLLSPVFDNICHSVGCGEGNCSESSESTFGYECKCKPGWMQFHIGESMRFLPCVIPNCTINYSCFNQSIAPAPAPLSQGTNFSLLDSCSWAYCGGGKCEESSDLGGHKCKCEDGYSNLLNITYFPCYKNCSLGANCADLGLTFSNSSSASPPSPNNLSDQNGSSNTRSLWGNTIMVLLVLVSFALL